MKGQSRSLVNNAGGTRMGEFGDILWKSYVYPKFCHMENMLMGGMAKSLADELSVESTDNAHAALRKKAVWALRVCLILIDNREYDEVNIWF